MDLLHPSDISDWQWTTLKICLVRDICCTKKVAEKKVQLHQSAPCEFVLISGMKCLYSQLQPFGHLYTKTSKCKTWLDNKLYMSSRCNQTKGERARLHWFFMKPEDICIKPAPSGSTTHNFLLCAMRAASSQVLMYCQYLKTFNAKNKYKFLWFNWIIIGYKI